MNEEFLENKPNAHPSSKISKIKLYTVTFESFLSRPCCLRWMGLQYSAYNFLRCVRPSRSWSAGGGGDVGSPSLDQGWYYIPPITMLGPGLLLHSTNHNDKVAFTFHQSQWQTVHRSDVTQERDSSKQKKNFFVEVLES